MQSKSRKMSLLILFLSLILVFCAVFTGVRQAQRVSALEGETASAEALSSEAEEAESAEGNNGYSVFYFVADGVTATALLGLSVTEGWELALWISLIFWILAAVASILMILFLQKFNAGDDTPFNTVALLGAIWAFFMPVAGFLLSMFGKRFSKTHEGGKPYYTVGLIVGGFFIVLAVVLAIIHACNPFLPF